MRRVKASMSYSGLSTFVINDFPGKPFSGALKKLGGFLME